MSIDLRKLVTTAVLRDTNYDLTAAYSDLAGRYVQMCGQLERAERRYSRAYAREVGDTRDAVRVQRQVAIVDAD